MTRTARIRLTAAVVWLACGLWYLAAEALAASDIPAYRYTVAYISDLGVPGDSPSAGLMNSGFIVQGLGFALACALMFTTVQRSPGALAWLFLGVVYGIGSTVVGVWHGSGQGAERSVHNGGATAAIVAGNLALITVGVVLWRRQRRRAGAVSATLGVLGLLSAIILVRPGLVGTVGWGAGGWERGAVYPIIAWQLVAGAALAVEVTRRTRRG